MTREEIIDFCDMKAQLEPENEDIFKAIIKVLEQESSGDNVVSRDVVKEQMIMYGFHAPDMTVTEFVEDLPPVNPKEPTTKNDVPENNAENIYICSCGYGWDKSKVVRYHFCPNCGKAVASATKNDLGDDKTFYEQMVEYCNEHFLVLVEKDVWEDAKKALTTKNDLGVDAVSRREVLYLIADNDLSMGQVVRGIHALPSVTPQEPRKGHWISTETKGVRYAFWCRYKCSLCGELSDHTNFCPNCGADMREVEV